MGGVLVLEAEILGRIDALISRHHPNFN